MATETKGKNTAVLTGRRNPWEMLGEAIVMGGVDDLIFQYRLLKKAVKRGSGIELAAKQAEYEESLYLWCKANLGTCRVNPMFATTYDYELIQIDNTKVIIDDNEPSAF